jgi:isopenicillin N synthase-like dioxygenase
VQRDPRVTFADNDKFIDMMEKYFEQPESAKKEDERPEVFYQVGVTPNGKEQARDHCAKVAAMPEQERPITECPPGADPKWRFFWRIGQTPAETKFARLSAPQVVPRAFPEWSSNMNAWGEKILATVFTVAEMAAIGFKLPRETFVSMLKMGPHLLAPTGSDMSKFGQLKTVFAKFHYDLNFLTIHGRSRYPGLYVWTRDGKRLPVKIPEGCLLLQAGKQFEYVTGGYVLAGFHEVVVSPATLETIEKARKVSAIARARDGMWPRVSRYADSRAGERAQNGKSLWRISSTLFAHVASDKILQPIESFATPEAKAKFPPLPAGEQVQNELKAIKLASPDAVTAM